jgi:hypothetical protein
LDLLRHREVLDRRALVGVDQALVALGLKLAQQRQGLALGGRLPLRPAPVPVGGELAPPDAVQVDRDKAVMLEAAQGIGFLGALGDPDRDRGVGEQRALPGRDVEARTQAGRPLVLDRARCVALAEARSVGPQQSGVGLLQTQAKDGKGDARQGQLAVGHGGVEGAPLRAAGDAAIATFGDHRLANGRGVELFPMGVAEDRAGAGVGLEGQMLFDIPDLASKYVDMLYLSRIDFLFKLIFYL